ncbi:MULTISPECIES: Rrf2 family transcriptional regulator [Rhodomicrobium]|uniref:Rrf2 family transcriptional regulator n=1 Tax=Rhodomicrobium TaxID=1068 RepID=UPI000B4A729C|nr:MULTISPECIES: Rrf2 family transcriptional regulator [Rhodomicrobium]
MQLNTKGRYAVMAMVDLAENGAQLSVPLAAIAERQHISIDYLEQLFMKLRRAGLVSAVRGPKGGYRLALAPAQISIAQIMQAADEPVRMNRCSVEGTDWCLGTKRCATHDLWQALGSHISEFLDAVSLQAVVDGTLAVPPAQKTDGVTVVQSVVAE